MSSVGLKNDPIEGMREFASSKDSLSIISIRESRDYLALIHGTTFVKSGMNLLEHSLDEFNPSGWTIDSYRMLDNAFDSF